MKSAGQEGDYGKIRCSILIAGTEAEGLFALPFSAARGAVELLAGAVALPAAGAIAGVELLILFEAAGLGCEAAGAFAD